MVGQIVEIVSKVDNKVWLVIAIIMAVVVVIGLIKKVAKLAIIIALVVMVSTGGASFISNTMDKYGVEFDGSYLSIHNGNTDIDVDLRDIVKIEVDKESASGTKLVITSRGKTSNIEVPDMAWNLLKGVVKGFDIPIVDY